MSADNNFIVTATKLISFFRRGDNDNWITYQGVISNVELVKLAYNSKTDSSDQKQVKKPDIVSNVVVSIIPLITANILSQLLKVELTPAVLIEIMKTDGLNTLLILVAEVVTNEQENILSKISQATTVYWLNRWVYEH